MAYQDALRRINKYEDERKEHEYDLRDNSIMNILNFNPKAALSLGLSGGALRAIATSGNATNSMLSSISPYAGMAALATLPLRGLQQSSQAKNIDTQIKSQQALNQESPKDLKIADITKTYGLGAKKISNTAMNTSMAMLAAGALTGNSALSTAALAPMGVAGLTGGPLRAATTAAGFANYAGLIGKTAAASPITAGMAYAPTVVGGVASTALNGLGGLANMAGLTKAGTALGTAAGGVSTGAAGITAAGLANPMIGMVAGMVTLMIAQPMVSKIMNKITAAATGSKMLSKEKGQRPRVKSASQLTKQFSQTAFLDQQVNMLGMQGRLKTGEWLQLSYLGAIERSVSLLGFVVEHIQQIQSQKDNGTDNVLDSMQFKYQQSGHDEEDLSGGYSKTDPQSEIDDMGEGFGKLFAQLKKGAMDKALSFTKKADLITSFMSPLDYFKSGSQNPFNKLSAQKEEDNFNDTAKKVSTSTGISLGGIIALETSATSLANMGESSEDKSVALLSGIFEVEKIAAFKLMDIANYLGIEKEDSFMGKFQEIMDEAEKGEEKSKWQKVMDDIKGLPYKMAKGALPLAGKLAMGTAGMANTVLGGVPGDIYDYSTNVARQGLNTAQGYGSLASLAVQNTADDAMDIAGQGLHQMGRIPVLGSMARGLLKGGSWLKDKTTNYLDSQDGESVSYSESLDNTDVDAILPDAGDGISVDASQLQLALDAEEAADKLKRFGMYENVAEILESMTDQTRGVYMRYSKAGNLRMNQFTGQFNKMIKCCEDGGGGTTIIGGLGGLKNVARLAGGVAALAGTGLMLGAMTTDPTFGDASLGDSFKYAGMGAFNGAITGFAMTGTLHGAVAGAVAGAVIAGVSAFAGTDIKDAFYGRETADPKTGKRTSRGETAKKKSYRNYFEAKHKEMFGILSDDGEYKTENGIDVFVENSGKKWDVKTGKRIDKKHTINNVVLSQAIKNNQPKVKNNVKILDNDQVTELQNKAAMDLLVKHRSEIASIDGDKNKIDTKEEHSLYMKALIGDTQAIGQLTISQQGQMVEALYASANQNMGGQAAIIEQLNNIVTNMYNDNTLFNEH